MLFMLSVTVSTGWHEITKLLYVYT